MQKISPVTRSPILQIIEIGLEAWIRSQCKSINKIKLQLYGSTRALITGKVSQVRLVANEVNYKDLKINSINLNSGVLNLGINLLNRKQHSHGAGSCNSSWLWCQ